MSNILIKKVLVADPHSSFHNQEISLLIKDSIIEKISTNESDFYLDEDIDIEYDAEGAYISPSWVDLRARVGNAYEQEQETLNSLANAAKAGGFGTVAILPESEPITDNAQVLDFFKNASEANGINFLPIGAISHQLEGKKLAEMMDMQTAGINLFAEKGFINSADILLKSLQYTQMLAGATVWNLPLDNTLSAFGQMHEGIQSALLGLKGIPVLAEELAIQRDLAILDYAGGNLHLGPLSSYQGVELVYNAKLNGFLVSSSIAAHQIAFNDEALQTFDTNLKVYPPFRSEDHRKGLIDALKKGMIDIVVSDHHPLEIEYKNLEFDLAHPGISGIQLVFPILNHYADISPEQVVLLLAHNPRKLAGLRALSIGEGEVASLTIFSKHQTTVVNDDTWQSKSKNTPFWNATLNGAVLAVVNEKSFEVVG